MPKRITIEIADITRQPVDAIVNAANRWMLGGGGVDHAIHMAAGPELEAECATYPADANGYRLQTGDAKITKGYNLPAKHVIHTAGPDCRTHEFATDPAARDAALASSYRRSLEVAKENGCKSVAFPAISIGIYEFPLERAAGIAAREISSFLTENPDMTVKMCIYDRTDPQRIKQAFDDAFTKAAVTCEAEDVAPAAAQSAVQMIDLQSHDLIYHGGHYDGKSKCRYREVMARGGSFDECVAAEQGEQKGTKRIHPKASLNGAPPAPYTDSDLQFLRDARERLEKTARCLNGRIGNIQALQASSRYPCLNSIADDTQLASGLAKLVANSDKAVSAAAKHLKDAHDGIVASKKSGWNTPTSFVDDASTFEAKLSISTAPITVKSEEELRTEEIDSLNKQVNGYTGADKGDLEKLVREAQEAHGALTDFEDNIGMIDEAVANETNPDAKKAIEEVIADIEISYAAARENYDLAVKALRKWASGQWVAGSGMNMPIKIDEYEQVFRYYRGEKNNPYDRNKESEFKKAHFWYFERCTFLVGEKAVDDFVAKDRLDILEGIDIELEDKYGATDGSFRVMAYMRFCSDEMMPVSAFRDYMSSGEAMPRRLIT